MYDIFIDKLPKIDLHGVDRDTARMLVNDFIEESIVLNHKEIVIVHGIGSGIVKNSVHETLRRNKNVINFKIDNCNIGCTKVYLK